MLRTKVTSHYALILISLCLVMMSCKTYALWLNAYGTAADEVKASQFLRLATGGYLVAGQAINDRELINWYGRLDEQGKVLWSKSSKNVSVTFDKNGSVTLQASQLVENAYINISASAKLEPDTGNLTNIAVDNNQVINGNNGKLVLSSVADIYAGTWKASNSDLDAVLVKMNADNQVEWSHHYDFAANDVVPEIVALKQGYLMVLSYYGFNPQTLQADWLNVFVRLDSTGNIISGSAKQFISHLAISPSILSDDSVVVASFGYTGDFSVYKLDPNLNFVWGKRYYSSSNKDVFINLAVVEGVDGELEMRPYRQRYDADGQLLEEHALGLVVSAEDGSIITKTEMQARHFDPYPLTESALNKYSLFGATSILAKDLSQDQDGVYAILNNNFQPEWMRLIAGQQYDQVELFAKADGAANYLLGGNTQSWGVGKSDMLFGKLDQNGDINNCSAIQQQNPVMVEPDIAAATLASPMAKAVVLDAGAVSASIDRLAYSLTLDLADYPLTVTSICASTDPVILPEVVTVTPPVTTKVTVTTSQPEPITSAAVFETVTTKITADVVSAVAKAISEEVVTTTIPGTPTLTSLVLQTGTVLTNVINSITLPVAFSETPVLPVSPVQPTITPVEATDNVDNTTSEVTAPKAGSVSVAVTPATQTPTVATVTNLDTGTIASSTKQLDFANVALQSSVNQEITLSNTGNGILNIGNISDLSVPFAKTSDNCKNKTLASGENCKIGISFAPTSAGIKTAKLEIASNDPATSTVSIVVQGAGENKEQPQSQKLDALSSTDVSVGTQEVIRGKGFGKSKGAVMVGVKAAVILAWSDTAIVFKVPALKASTYSVKLINKAKKILQTLKLSVRLPKVLTVSQTEFSGTGKLSLTGQYFGMSSKPKVYLVSANNRREMTVLAGNTETTLQFKMPKLKANNYQIVVSNNVGSSADGISLKVK